MFEVVKRDGQVTEFNLGKINDAIAKAFDATQMSYNDDIIGLLSLRVSAHFQDKIKDGKVSVEAIQDSVETVLEQTGYTEVAKAYILYRKQREKMRNMKSTILDYKDVINSYVKVEDWRVKENSTVTYSVGGLILSNSGAVTANYWLSEIYDEEIAEAHRNADIHIHDLSMLTGYCRLVFEAVDSGRSGRYFRQDHICSGSTFIRALQSDGKLPRHYAERMGRSTGFLFF